MRALIPSAESDLHYGRIHSLQLGRTFQGDIYGRFSCVSDSDVLSSFSSRHIQHLNRYSWRVLPTLQSLPLGGQ